MGARTMTGLGMLRVFDEVVFETTPLDGASLKRN